MIARWLLFLWIAAWTVIALLWAPLVPLLGATTLSAREIAERALTIAGDICIYTNGSRTFEEL